MSFPGGNRHVWLGAFFLVCLCLNVQPAIAQDPADDFDVEATEIPRHVALTVTNGSRAYTYSAVAIDEFHILTSNTAIRASRPKAELFGVDETSAGLTFIAEDDDAGVAIWRVASSVTLSPVSFAQGPLSAGDTGTLTFARGGNASDLFGDITVPSADALITYRSPPPFEAIGGGVFNRCGELTSLSVPGSDYRSRQLRRKDPLEPVQELVTLSSLKTFAEANGAVPVISEQTCASAVEEAQQAVVQAREEAAARKEEAVDLREQAEQAADRASEQEQRAAELQAQAESDQAGKAAAERAAREAQNEAERVREEAQLASDRAETAEADLEQYDAALNDAEADLVAIEDELDTAIDDRDRWQIYAGIGAGLALLIAIIGAFLVARRSRVANVAKAEVVVADQEIQRLRAIPKAIPSVDDILLEGEDRNLILAGGLLPDAAGGVIVGRHPQYAQTVLEPDDVSRKHVRFFVRDGQMMVEDLGSSYGTKLNGETLAPNAPKPMSAGDQVLIASHAFIVRNAGRKG